MMKLTRSPKAVYSRDDIWATLKSLGKKKQRQKNDQVRLSFPPAHEMGALSQIKIDVEKLKIHDIS